MGSFGGKVFGVAVGGVGSIAECGDRLPTFLGWRRHCRRKGE